MKILFLILFFCVTANAADPVQSNYDTEVKIKAEFQNIYKLLTDGQLDLYTSTPMAKDLTEREFVVMSASATVNSLLIKINGFVWKVQLSTP